jgi:predicted nucleic acid-binding OB-fold protein
VEAIIIEEEKIRQEILENGSKKQIESFEQVKQIADEWLDKKGVTLEE